MALGGAVFAGDQTGKQATSDLAIAELIAFPLLALLSLLVFRGVAALLPVAIGGLSVLGTFALLRAINTVLALSPFALNLVIGLGLGLAVDYSLFFVSRFREELGRGADVPRRGARDDGDRRADGVVQRGDGGRGDGVPDRVPRSGFSSRWGSAACVVALVAAGSTLVFLPALFVLLGTAAREGELRRRRAAGRWYRLARAVMRRPGIGRRCSRRRPAGAGDAGTRDPLERHRRVRVAGGQERPDGLGRDRDGSFPAPTATP